MGRAWLGAFRGCLTPKVARTTVMAKQVSRTTEEDGPGLGNVSTGKLVLGQGQRSQK